MDHDTRADSQSRYKSTLAFTDLLFNVLIGFAFLFIIAFILINPITEEAHIKAKAEFMVIMEWDDKSNYDIDLWMQDPLDTIVGFPNKESGWLHLDKDDLGASNDTVTMRDGTTKTIYLNREIMTVRGIAAGEYIANIHLYSTKGKNTGPMPVHVSIMKINPYGEVYSGVTTLNVNGQEETVQRFTVNNTGEVISKNKLQKRFAGKHLPGSGSTVSGGSQSSETGFGFNRPPTMNSGAGQDIVEDEPADDDELFDHNNSGSIEIQDSIDEKEEMERRSFTIGGGGDVVETDEELNRYDSPSHPNSDSESNSDLEDEDSRFNSMGGF